MPCQSVFINNNNPDPCPSSTNDRMTRRWPQHLLCNAELVRAHRHVLLLHGGCDGSQVPEVHLVEEVPDRLPDAAVRRHLHAPVPVALPQGLRLPLRVHGEWLLRCSGKGMMTWTISGVDRTARNHVPVPVLRLLQGQVPVSEEWTGGEEEGSHEWRREGG